MKLSLVAISLAFAPSVALAQQALVSLAGQAGERFGASVKPFRDVNGDGFVDVLVGAPGSQFGNGAVYVVSGQFLAVGTGASILHLVQPGTTAGTSYAFGSSIVVVSDLTGDGVADFVVGAPSIDYFPVGTDSGAIYLINGATMFQHSIVWGGVANQRFGSCLAVVGDSNLDGKVDIAVGAPGVYNQLSGGVSVLSGAGIAAAGGSGVYALSITVTAYGGEAGFGTSIASGFDLDGDGSNDIAVGSPFTTFTNGPTEAGAVWIMRTSPTPPGQSAHVYASYRSTIPFEHLGRAIDAAHDYDGDGVVDIVAGAPDRILGINAQTGRVVVLSGARVATNTLPKELYVLESPNPNVTFSTFHFGAGVCASPDLNGDGVGDFIVGAPDYFTQFPSGPGRGGASIYSGATGLRLGGLSGSNNERIGDGLAGGVGDLDGDGFTDFLVAGSSADTPSTDCGKLKSYRLFPTFPSVYCTGKVNSLGCTPAISYSGSASTSSATPFAITCSNTLNQRVGLLTYSHLPNSVPFQGGVLCIGSPFRRSATQLSGGSASGADCTGAFAFDFNVLIQNGSDPSLVAGAEMFAQFRSRDPQAVGSSSLSNALRFVINP